MTFYGQTNAIGANFYDWATISTGQSALPTALPTSGVVSSGFSFQAGIK
jgi:hypothetical protein